MSCIRKSETVRKVWKAKDEKAKKPKEKLDKTVTMKDKECQVSVCAWNPEVISLC